MLVNIPLVPAAGQHFNPLILIDSSSNHVVNVQTMATAKEEEAGKQRNPQKTDSWFMNLEDGDFMSMGSGRREGPDFMESRTRGGSWLDRLYRWSCGVLQAFSQFLCCLCQPTL